MLSTQQQEVNGLLDGFQVYKLPLNMSQDYIDSIDGHVHRFQNRCLGVSTIKSGSKVYPNATFYEITESEISDLSSTPEEEESLDVTKLLPPKKRKRRRMIRYEIIFSIDKGQVQLTPEFLFFVLPRDAITECLTETVPHKLLFSFFPQSCGISHCSCHSYPTPVMEEGSYKTKLEEFAAVCSTSCKLTLPDQPKSDGHVNNIILTHVPIELFRAIKQMVSSYEIMCQNMMELMKLHHEKIVHHKAEIDYLPAETAMITLPNQSDDDYHVTKNEDWSSSDEDHVKTDILPISPPEIPNKKSPPIQQKGRGNNTSNQIKKCLYCGSKSTPMWRRGPQGAGTLCNACGVKWKHGKILNGSDTVMNDISTTNINTTNQRRNSNNNNKGEKKRKRSNTTIGNKRNNKKRNSSTSVEYYDTFAVPAPMHPSTTQQQQQQQQQQQWESSSNTATNSSSSTSSSRSPLESFSSSPNTSPSITTLMDQQDLKRDITSLLSYDTETLSVYVGEDAVEAAAVLTLLKRS